MPRKKRRNIFCRRITAKIGEAAQQIFRAAKFLSSQGRHGFRSNDLMRKIHTNAR
jgi:hypothetical protein